MMKFEGMSSDYAHTLSIINAILTSVFGLEAILKMYGLGLRGYFSDGWNIFDIIVVIGSVIDIGLDGQSVNVSFLRIFRAARLVKLMKKGEIKRILFTFVRSLRALPWVGLMILMVFFVYAIVGMRVFGRVQLNESLPINSRNNFQTFPMVSWFGSFDFFFKKKRKKRGNFIRRFDYWYFFYIFHVHVCVCLQGHAGPVPLLDRGELAANHGWPAPESSRLQPRRPRWLNVWQQLQHLLHGVVHLLVRVPVYQPAGCGCRRQLWLHHRGRGHPWKNFNRKWRERERERERERKGRKGDKERGQREGREREERWGKAESSSTFFFF